MTYNEAYNQILQTYLCSEHGFRCDNSRQDWELLFNRPEISGANWITQANYHIAQSTGVDYFLNIARGLLNISINPPAITAEKPEEDYDNKAVDSWEVVNDSLVQSWEVVKKTDLEKWHEIDYPKRLVAHELMFLSDDPVVSARVNMFWNLFTSRKLPVHNEAGQLFIYCRFIEEQYAGIATQMGIVIEEKPEA